MKTSVRLISLGFLLTSGVLAGCGEGDLVAPTAPETSPFLVSASARSNTLTICHTQGNGVVRELRVNPSAQSDHMGHGDWLPLQFFVDVDGDGYGGGTAVTSCVILPGLSENALDCDDGDPTSHPGAPEIEGDHKDNDCDGWVDEGWTSWKNTAIAAARKAAREWMAGANVQASACHLNAPVALAGPGSVRGPDVAGKVRQALLDAGASSAVSSAWDGAFTGAWRGWSEAITIPALPWYPTLVAYPGPYAPPMPNIPMPLAAMVSVGASGMGQDALADRISSALGSDAGAPGARGAVDAFAADISARFSGSLAMSVANVMGEGPVPTFAPPFVPVGPVLGGSCWGGDFPTSPWN